MENRDLAWVDFSSLVPLPKHIVAILSDLASSGTSRLDLQANEKRATFKMKYTATAALGKRF